MNRDVVRDFLMRFLVCASAMQMEILADIVIALIQAGKAGFTPIARELKGTKSLPARLAQTYRGCRNLPTGRQVCEAMAQLMLSHRHKHVLLATDWTDMGGFKVLVTALITPSRAIPLMWSAMPVVFGDQAATERSHFLELHESLPVGVSYILTADRGFGHSRIATLLGSFCFFVLRSTSNVSIRKPGESEFTKITNVGYRKDEVQDFGVVDYCASRTIHVRVIRVGHAKYRDPWVLLTNLEAPAKTVIRCYACRFRIEEMFRDFKDTRFGFHLRGNTLDNPQSFDRLLVIVTCSYLLLELLGLHAERRGWCGKYESTASIRRLARWRTGRMVALDADRAPLVKIQHLEDQLPNITLKVGQWDWTPRPEQQLESWPELTGEEAYCVRRKPLPRVESEADFALRQRLYHLLKQKKLTQATLAQHLGRGEGFISNVMRGRKAVPAFWIPMLADFFGISEGALLATTGWVPRSR